MTWATSRRYLFLASSAQKKFEVICALDFCEIAVATAEEAGEDLETVLLIGDLRAVMTLVMQRLCFTALYFASICIVVELRETFMPGSD
jgi:hypothetical protein